MFVSCFDPRDFGAIADGRTKDTVAVQAAIDAAASHGGTVRLAGGIFVCGTLYLKSNVALEITNSATLLASPDIADYGTDTHHNRYRNEPELDRCFLFAQDAENVTICGSGVIDGNAAAFPQRGQYLPPHAAAGAALPQCPRDRPAAAECCRVDNSVSGQRFPLGNRPAH